MRNNKDVISEIFVFHCSTISTSVLFHFYLKCVIYVAPVISAEELQGRTQGFAVTHLFCSLLVTLPCAEHKAVLK
jgi:hypothetical protein